MVRMLFWATVAAHSGPFFAALHFLRARDVGLGAALGLAFLASLFGVLGFVARVWNGLEDRKGEELLVRLFYVPYFVHWCACVFAFVPNAIYLVVRPIVGLSTGAPLLPLGYFFGTYVTGLLVAGYGILLRRRLVQTLRVDVRVKDLPKAFDGYTIAHLSDLHIGAFTPESWGLAWASLANSLSADAAVVTGDMVTSGTAFHVDIANVVGALRAKDGVFVSMGNHDYFGEGEPLIGYLRERNVRVLRNEGLHLERAGERVYLAAIDDTWTGRADMAAALAERPTNMPCILLAHDPEVFPKAVEKGVDLMLSGHTHGGQIAVPFLGKHLSLATLAHHFNVGTYRENDATLYVSPGLGTTGPPIRLGSAPAITLLTLRPK